MRRISSIRTHREAELEKRREELRDSRWNRRRSMVVTVVGTASALTATAAGGPPLLRALRQLAGL